MLDVAVRPRILRAPDPNPPYDAIDYAWRPEPQVAGQGVLPLDFRSSRLGARSPLALEPTGAEGRTDAEPFSRMLARALADGVTGTRTPAQLRPWLNRNVQRRLAFASRLAGGARYTVGEVHLGCPAGDVVEVAATLHGRDHAHAMAFRLEARGRSWVCTVLEVGLLPRR